MSDIRSSFSLLGGLGAQRVVRRLLTKALRNALAIAPAMARELVHEQLLQKLREQQGEFMYWAPQELSPAEQAQVNVAFQEAYRELIAETMDLLEAKKSGGSKGET
jgi:hypothetical protein